MSDWTPNLPEISEQCASCPFLEGNGIQMEAALRRTGIGGFGKLIGPWAVEQTRQAARRLITRSDGQFVCHNTVYDGTNDYRPESDYRQCKGAADLRRCRGPTRFVIWGDKKE